MNATTSAALAVFDRIVCGVDGTPEALEAARQAERLRSPDGVLQLAAVTEVDTAVHAGFAMSHVLEELETAAREGLQRAADGVNPTATRQLAGEAAACLLDEIEQTNATLVAVGPRGHSRTAGALFGGVAATLLHDAPCSVLLARPPQFGEFPASIVVGVDGSPQSLAAASVAKVLAERFGSEYLIVAATGGDRIDRAPIQALSPYFVTDPGRPAEVLTDLSKEADLLVVGSRGLHGLKALGSVSERVGHWASSSVLVVRQH
ncbi:MAG TPA: universal stress protein [Gaiellaceae bacterium]|nr:universal stress protein [Gaiellaceae bacterium]